MPEAPAVRWSDALLARHLRLGWRGFTRLHRLLRGADGPAALRYRTAQGATFELDPFSYIGHHVLREGFYESEVLTALREAVFPGAVVWDIGANFGLHSVTLARLHPKATVIAFEPNPHEHARLLRHRAWNAPTLLTSTLALSDRTGTLPLHLGPEGNSGMTTLSPWSGAAYSGIVHCAVTTGDALVAAGTLPAPHLIKLDVEGHEPQVLAGLSRTLASADCRLVVLEDHREQDSPAKQLLRAAGFTLEPLLRAEATDHPLVNFAARKRAP